MPILSSLVLATAGVLSIADAKSSASTAMVADKARIQSFVQKAIAGGFPSKLPPPLGDLVGLPAESRYLGVRISADQATDSMVHSARVIVEGSSDRPTCLVFETDARSSEQGKVDYWFRASLDGRLEKATLLRAQLDENGKGIKGSGTTASQDVTSPDVKERFQHELDLWLKKSHLKKEWRNAEFSGGVLAKKARRTQ